MSLDNLLPETARIERYEVGLDDRGDESGGHWNVLGTFPARFQEIFGSKSFSGSN